MNIILLQLIFFIFLLIFKSFDFQDFEFHFDLNIAFILKNLINLYFNPFSKLAFVKLGQYLAIVFSNSLVLSVFSSMKSLYAFPISLM